MNLLSKIEVGCSGDNFQFCEWLFFLSTRSAPPTPSQLHFCNRAFRAFRAQKKVQLVTIDAVSHCRSPPKMHKIIFIPQTEWITSNGTENFDIKAVMCSQSHRHCVEKKFMSCSKPQCLRKFIFTNTARREDGTWFPNGIEQRIVGSKLWLLLFYSPVVEVFVVCFSLFCDPLYQFRAAETREWNEKTKVFLLFALRYCLEARPMLPWACEPKVVKLDERSDHQRW